MYQIDNSTAVTVIPASTAAGSVGFFTDGNPVSNIPATILPAEFMNMLMMEMLGVLSAAGVAPSKAAFSQLTLAIRGLIQSGTALYALDTGSANVYTVAFTPVVTALVDGMVLKFKAKTANAGASTFNPNGFGAKPIVGSAHAALQGSEIIANSDVWVQYNSSIGAGSWVLIDSTGGALQVGVATQSQHAMQLGQAVGRLLGPPVVITASGTYTPTPGMKNARIRGVGGTGGSGGVAATVAAQTAVSGGTAAGSYFDAWLSAATIGASQSVIIGGAGAAGAVGANGSAGGATSFGALLNAPGSLGSGAAGAVSTSSAGVSPGGAQGAVATGGNVINGIGSAGASGLTVNGGTAPGAGGSSHLGAPGASGVTNNPSAAAKGGTAGSPGILIIEEYA